METGVALGRTHEGDRGLAAVALVAIVLITIAWWALALWPVGADAPEWMLRTRFACFGARGSELPHAGGWVLLIGEPIGMVGTLYAVWGDALRRDLTWMRQHAWGVVTLAVLVAMTGTGMVLAVGRVAGALATGAERIDVPAQVFDAGKREMAPALRLVDQSGSLFELASLRGQPVVVTFAFGHCETMCPTLVRDVLNARLAAGSQVPVIVVTVDPWRDVPERLPHIATAWGLATRDRVLSGAVDDVTTALDAWGVRIVRDEATGDVGHPAVVVLVDAEGRIEARLGSDVSGLVALLKP
ncbi:MAG: SCO family protein [Gemmatimonadetes bacterium]|nr:SCO family protein [Gemmatimonadota bacterium]